MTPEALAREIARFDPTLPIERAHTPPASWYLEPGFLDLERRRVFRRSWQAVGRLDQLAHPGDFFSGGLADDPYVVLRGDDGALRAFHNVCRHHAAQVCTGEGRLSELTCPYHGWTYRLDGRLTKAPRLGTSAVFDRERFSLEPISVAAWGPLVFIHFEKNPPPLEAQLAPLAPRLAAMGTDALTFAARKVYDIECNWKVYVDNYLDGGYHVSVLHRALAGQLDLDTYTTELFDRVSIQSCRSPEETPPDAGGDFAERIGEAALYAFVYPNFMLNRYGPILDTNWVLPVGHDKTRVVFDFYFKDVAGSAARAFIERSVAASHRVQMEDVGIAESVQTGLGSPAYDRGIYAPAIEAAAYHFHRLLAADLRGE